MTDLLAPVSVGELIDKITILKIKRRMIKDAGKLLNIEAEMLSWSSRSGVKLRQRQPQHV